MCDVKSQVLKNLIPSFDVFLGNPISYFKYVKNRDKVCYIRSRTETLGKKCTIIRKQNVLLH